MYEEFQNIKQEESLHTSNFDPILASSVLLI